MNSLPGTQTLYVGCAVINSEHLHALMRWKCCPDSLAWFRYHQRCCKFRQIYFNHGSLNSKRKISMQPVQCLRSSYMLKKTVTCKSPNKTLNQLKLDIYQSKRESKRKGAREEEKTKWEREGDRKIKRRRKKENGKREGTERNEGKNLPATVIPSKGGMVGERRRKVVEAKQEDALQ